MSEQALELLKHLGKCVSVFGLAMVRPSAAPILAYASGLHIAESIVLVACGIVLSVTLVAAVGHRVRAYFAARRERLGKPERVRELNPRARVVWEKYGMAGIAFITPLLLSPIGGGMAAAGFAVPRPKIILHTAWAGAFWAVVYSIAWYFFGDAIRAFFA